jgi:hypothetical protein
MMPKSPEPAAAEPMPLHQNATAPRHKMPLTMARYTSPCDEDAVLLPAVFGSEVAFSAPETMHAWRIATATNSHFRRTMLEVSVNYSYNLCRALSNCHYNLEVARREYRCI